MREVSTELEKKLESRHKERPITVTSTSQVLLLRFQQKIIDIMLFHISWDESHDLQVSARKGRAPATPSRPATTSTTTTNGVDKDKAGPGITFNPVAEVVEVEKRQRAVSVSSHGWVWEIIPSWRWSSKMLNTEKVPKVKISFREQNKFFFSRSTVSGSSISSSGSSAVDNDEETTRIWVNNLWPEKVYGEWGYSYLFLRNILLLPHCVRWCGLD